MKTEGKVCVSVAIALLLLEGAARLLEPHLSRDVEEMLARSSIPDRIEEHRETGGFAVLVIGNSLARANIHRETFESQLAAKGYQNPAIFFLTADGTNINEWNASYRKYFAGGTAKPDWIVWVTGPGHLVDQPPSSPERLAAYHSAVSDMPIALGEWLTETNSRARFLLAWCSRLFACRERVRPLLFYNFVPGFEATSEAINQREKSQRKNPEPGNGRASRFMSALESAGIPGQRMFVIAAALPSSYQLPDAVKEVAKREGVAVFESGAKRKWGADAFPDGYHLSEARSIDFTRGAVAEMPLP